MARGRKTGGRNFKPGQSGNPQGRPKATVSVTTFGKINLINQTLLMCRLTTATKSELKSDLKQKKLPALYLSLAEMLLAEFWNQENGKELLKALDCYNKSLIQQAENKKKQSISLLNKKYGKELARPLFDLKILTRNLQLQLKEKIKNG